MTSTSTHGLYPWRGRQKDIGPGGGRVSGRSQEEWKVRRTVKTFPNRTAAGAPPRRAVVVLACIEAVVVLGLPRVCPGCVRGVLDRWVRPRCDRRAQTRRPWQPELAMGAIGEDGVRVTNDDVPRRQESLLASLQPSRHANAELERRARRFRGDGRRQPLRTNSGHRRRWHRDRIYRTRCMPERPGSLSGPNRARRAGRAARLALTMRW